VKKQNIETVMATPEPQQVSYGIAEGKNPFYVVVREGFRVSDREYTSPNDPAAEEEADFWHRVAQRHSYGEPVQIVQYESKKHRIW
jgi:hypothetical protein